MLDVLWCCEGVRGTAKELWLCAALLGSARKSDAQVLQEKKRLRHGLGFGDFADLLLVTASLYCKIAPFLSIAKEQFADRLSRKACVHEPPCSKWFQNQFFCDDRIRKKTRKKDLIEEEGE